MLMGLQLTGHAERGRLRGAASAAGSLIPRQLRKGLKARAREKAAGARSQRARSAANALVRDHRSEAGDEAHAALPRDLGASADVVRATPSANAFDPLRPVRSCHDCQLLLTVAPPGHVHAPVGFPYLRSCHVIATTIVFHSTTH